MNIKQEASEHQMEDIEMTAHFNRVSYCKACSKQVNEDEKVTHILQCPKNPAIIQQKKFQNKHIQQLYQKTRRNQHSLEKRMNDQQQSKDLIEITRQIQAENNYQNKIIRNILIGYYENKINQLKNKMKESLEIINCKSKPFSKKITKMIMNQHRNHFSEDGLELNTKQNDIDYDLLDSIVTANNNINQEIIQFIEAEINKNKQNENNQSRFNHNLKQLTQNQNLIEKCQEEVKKDSQFKAPNFNSPVPTFSRNNDISTRETKNLDSTLEKVTSQKKLQEFIQMPDEYSISELGEYDINKQMEIIHKEDMIKPQVQQNQEEQKTAQVKKRDEKQQTKKETKVKKLKQQQGSHNEGEKKKPVKTIYTVEKINGWKLKQLKIDIKKGNTLQEKEILDDYRMKTIDGFGIIGIKVNLNGKLVKRKIVIGLTSEFDLGELPQKDQAYERLWKYENHKFKGYSHIIYQNNQIMIIGGNESCVNDKFAFYYDAKNELQIIKSDLPFLQKRRCNHSSFLLNDRYLIVCFGMTTLTNGTQIFAHNAEVLDLREERESQGVGSFRVVDIEFGGERKDAVKPDVNFQNTMVFQGGDDFWYFFGGDYSKKFGRKENKYAQLYKLQATWDEDLKLSNLVITQVPNVKFNGSPEFSQNLPNKIYFEDIKTWKFYDNDGNEHILNWENMTTNYEEPKKK